MENLLVACSNLVGIYPIAAAWQRFDYFSALALGAAMVASFFYHSIETEKHQFPGLLGKEFGRRWHRFAINLDRVCATIAVIVVFLQYWERINIGVRNLSFFGLSFLIISEMDERAYWSYIAMHCLWHVTAFVVAHHLVTI